jgi:chromosome segregation and condensation protein ScpB
MANTLTIKIRDKKAHKLLKSLEEVKLISIVDNTKAKWSPKKKKQAKDFLSALKQAKLAEEGKIKLKTAQSLIDEL